MIIVGYTTDGRQIQRTHGGSYIETIAERDKRLVDERLKRVEKAAPELLIALKCLVRWPTSPDMIKKAKIAIEKAESK